MLDARSSCHALSEADFDRLQVNMVLRCGGRMVYRDGIGLVQGVLIARHYEPFVQTHSGSVRMGDPSK